MQLALRIFIFLTTCLVQSFLSTPSNHALHRRMHDVVEDGSDISHLAAPITGHSDAMGETIPDAKSLKTTSSLHEPSPTTPGTLHGDSTDLESATGSHVHSYVAQGDNPAAVAKLGHTSFWGRVRREFFETIDRFGRFFRRLGQWRFKRAPRAFDMPFEKQLASYHLPNDQEIGEVVDKLVVEWSSKSNQKSFLHLAKEEELNTFKTRLKSNFVNLRDFTQDFATKNAELLDSRNKIFGRIGPILQSNDSPKLQATLAKKISAYRTEKLWYDQRILSRWLLEKDEKYLADSFGILGPKNVLSDVVQSMISRAKEAGNWKIPPNLDAKIFVDKLALLQQKLAIMSDYDRAVALAIQERRKNPDYPYRVMQDISEIEQQLAGMFGGRKVLQNVLNKIQTSDFVKSFNLELTDPRSEAAYELQLIEPWGTLRKLESVPFRELMMQNLGISETIGAHQLVEQQAPFAVQNIKSRLEFSANARELEERLRSMLSANALQKILDTFLQKASLKTTT